MVIEGTLFTTSEQLSTNFHTFKTLDWLGKICPWGEIYIFDNTECSFWNGISAFASSVCPVRICSKVSPC